MDFLMKFQIFAHDLDVTLMGRNMNVVIAHKRNQINFKTISIFEFYKNSYITNSI